jgi:hypothetical protein
MHGRRSRDRYMFTIHCENIVRAATHKATSGSPEAEGIGPRKSAARIASLFGAGSTHPSFFESRHGSSPTSASNMNGQKTPRRLHPDMIRRIDDALKLVDPSGSIIEGQAGPSNVRSMNQSDSLSSTALRELQHLLAQESGSTSLRRPVSSGESPVGQPLELPW